VDIAVSFVFTYDAKCNFGVPTFLCVKFLPEISEVFKHPKVPLVTALAAAAIFGNRKIAICRLRFDRFRRNSAGWRSLILLSLPTVKIPKI